MIYSVVSKIPYDERYTLGRCIKSLRVAFNPCNPQSDWNTRVAAGSALALVGVALATRYETLGKGVALASGVSAVLLPVIRKVWVTIWPDPFWAWDEIERIANEKCQLALISTTTMMLSLSSYYTWPSLINRGEKHNHLNDAWLNEHAQELYKNPQFFELLIDRVPGKDRLGAQLSALWPISSDTWKLYCHRDRLQAEIVEKGYTPEKGAELICVSRLLTDIAFKDLTMIHAGDLKAMGAKLKSQRSPHYRYAFAMTTSYWFLRQKVNYDDTLFTSWKDTYNKMCEDLAPLWEHTDDSRFLYWHTKDESPTQSPPNVPQPS